MTMRTYRYFVCAYGHKGEEKTSENDQPYSMARESVTVTGMKESGKDLMGYATYTCLQCAKPMLRSAKPEEKKFEHQCTTSHVCHQRAR
jgi:hypothetical protein